MAVTVSGPGAAAQLAADGPFRQFADSVTKTLADAVKRAFGSSGTATVSVDIRYLPVVAGEPVDLPGAADGTRIASPWLDISIDTGPQPAVRATITWNERDFLLDQVRLADAAGIGSDTPSPLAPAQWADWLDRYQSQVLLAPSPEARAEALAQLGKSMPPDLYWLLTHAWQSTLAPFETAVEHDLDTFLRRAGPHYAALVGTLIQQAFDGSEPGRTYTSILDLQRVADLHAIRVETLH